MRDGGIDVVVDFEEYFDRAAKKGALGGGVSILPISTPMGEFQGWTKRTGNNPDVALLLHVVPVRRTNT